MDVIAIAWASTYEKTAGAARGYLQSGATRWLLDEDDSIFAAFGVGIQPAGVLVVDGVEVARWHGAAGEQALREAFEMVTANAEPEPEPEPDPEPAGWNLYTGSDYVTAAIEGRPYAYQIGTTISLNVTCSNSTDLTADLQYSDADAWPDNAHQASISFNAGHPGPQLWSESRTVFAATASIDNHSLILDIDDPERLALHGVPHAAEDEDEDPVRGSFTAPVYDTSTVDLWAYTPAAAGNWTSYAGSWFRFSHNIEALNNVLASCGY